MLENFPLPLFFIEPLPGSKEYYFDPDVKAIFLSTWIEKQVEQDVPIPPGTAVGTVRC